MLTDNIFLGVCLSSNFLEKQNFSEASMCPFSGKEAPNLTYPLDWAILSHWAVQKQ